LINRKFTRGDTLVPLYATLQDGAGTAISLTDQTITFYMENVADHTLKVNGSAASIQDAAAGEVLYSWAAADVNTVGKFWGWFVRTYGGKRGTHPIGEQLLIEFVDGPLDT
jgi:hypothetical protein